MHTIGQPARYGNYLGDHSFTAGQMQISSGLVSQSVRGDLDLVPRNQDFGLFFYSISHNKIIGREKVFPHGPVTACLTDCLAACPVVGCRCCC